MPQVQMVNSTVDKPEPTGVEQFFSKLSKDYADKQDRSKIGEIMKEYAQHADDVKAYSQARGSLESSDIGPTQRLAATKSLDEHENMLIKKGKLLNDQAKIAATAAKSTKAKEKATAIKHARSLVGRQREISQTGHLGPIVSTLGTSRKLGSTTSSEGQTLREEYKRLGKALISSATTIPIKNILEFKVIADDLYDPDKTNEEIKGSLDAMDRILKDAEEEDNETEQKESAPSIKEGQTASGPGGKKIVFKGGKWQPV